MKKAIGFVRMNCRKPDAEKQKKEIEEYCRTHGLELADIVCGNDICDVAYGSWGHKKVDAVVVVSNITATENVFIFYACKGKLLSRGCELIAVEWSDYPGYAIHRNVLEKLVSVMGEKEFEHEPVRNPQGRARKARKGGYIGGNAPMGYKVVDGMLEVNPEEVPVVLFIMEEKHAGRTKTGTVEKLNAKGYKTRRGGPFQISTVQGIWNNEKFYQGYYRVKGSGEWVAGQHEAILKE